MRLRSYQSDCVDRIMADLQWSPSSLAVLATGLGKTVIGAALAQRWLAERSGRVLWLAHREELIAQAAQALEQYCQTPVSVDMAENRGSYDGFMPTDIVAASVATLSRPRRLQRCCADKFGLIVTDEAHHAVARTYRAIYDHFKEANLEIRHVGITATPCRSDRSPLRRIFTTASFEMPIGAGIERGWLVPVKQAMAVVDKLDLSQVRIVGGDFHQGELEAALTDKDTNIVLKMTEPIVAQSGDKQTIVFTVGKKQARLLCAALNSAKPDSAVYVCEDTSKEERRTAVEDFRSGRVQFFCNCGIATEGFDAVKVALVAIARPTKSLTLYTQMLGRATRPLANTVDGKSDVAARKAAIAASAKPSATILDFVGNVDLHADNVFVTAADVLGEHKDAAIRSYAKRLLLDGDGERGDVAEALERAEAELALLAEEDERLRSIVARPDYYIHEHQMQAYRPTPAVNMIGSRTVPATAKQIWKLGCLGVPRYRAEQYSKHAASKLIAELIRQRSEGFVYG